VRSWIVCGVVVLVACGGRIAGGGDGGAGPTGSGSGSSSSSSGAPGSGSGGGAPSSGDASFPVCPPDPPGVGTPCTVGPGQGCAYVDGTACQSFVCDSNGDWQSTTAGC